MPRALLAALLLAGIAPAAEVKLSVKVEDAPPPKELAEPIRALLDTKGLTVRDGDKPLLTVWPRKELPSKATAEQAKAGLKYSNLEEGTVLGAVRFPAEWVDYRKQKIKPGVYTLRLGTQPMDGDHMGTAPYSDFALLCPAAEDKTPAPLGMKELHELSTQSTTRKHPGIMLLFPTPKAADAPGVESKPQDHWLLTFRTPVAAGGGKASLGIGVVVVGVTMAE